MVPSVPADSALLATVTKVATQLANSNAFQLKLSDYDYYHLRFVVNFRPNPRNGWAW